MCHKGLSSHSSRTSPQVLHCQPKPWDEKQIDYCLAGGLFIACVLCAQPWARPSWEQWKAACAWRSPEGSGQVRRTQGRSTHWVCVGRWVLTCPHVLSQVQIRKGSCRLCTQIDNSQETFRGFLDLVLMLKSFLSLFYSQPSCIQVNIDVISHLGSLAPYRSTAPIPSWAGVGQVLLHTSWGQGALTL